MIGIIAIYFLTKYLHKYNHFQPPDVADFFHGEGNYQLSHMF